MTTIQRTIQLILAGFLLSATASSCKDFLDIGAPKTELISSTVFSDQATAINAMTGVYGAMMSDNNFISDYCSSDLAQAADEFVGAGSPVSAYYTNSLTVANDDFWTRGYKFIYQANAIREGVRKSTSLADSTVRQIEGETLFVRAFCHFYLVNLFGEIPYITSTDFRVNNLAVREPVAQVYDKIIADLLQARDEVADYYVDASDKAYPTAAQTERIRPNKAVITAMLARVYLYSGQWEKAEAEATTLINNPLYQLPTDLTTVFLKNSVETIWQLQPSNLTWTNGYSAANYVQDGGFAIGRPTMQASLYNLPEAGDKRKTAWMGDNVQFGIIHQYFAWKYKNKTQSLPATEYYMVFRLGEQYLIRAEARANLGNVEGAVADLNVLRARARATPQALPDYPATLSKADCLAKVAYERRVELFSEWGHRWLDLKRTGKADEILGPLKGDKWQTTDQLFPIPATQLNLNPNMTGQQNPGYNS